MSNAAVALTDTFGLDAQAFGVYVSGGDGSVLTAENRDTLVVQTAADLAVLSISNQSVAGAGDEDISVSIAVVNRGSARARVENVTLDFRNGNQNYVRDYTPPPSLPFDLGGGDTATVAYTVAVQEDAQLGIDSLRSTVQGTELNRNVSLSRTSSYLSFWQITGVGDLWIESVQAAQSFVSVGQQGIPGNGKYS